MEMRSHRSDAFGEWVRPTKRTARVAIEEYRYWRVNDQGLLSYFSGCAIVRFPQNSSKNEALLDYSEEESDMVIYAGWLTCMSAKCAYKNIHDARNRIPVEDLVDVLDQTTYIRPPNTKDDGKCKQRQAIDRYGQNTQQSWPAAREERQRLVVL